MMAIDAHHLLRRLEPAIRQNAQVLPGKAPLDRAEFDDLLARAERGELGSSRKVDTSAMDEPIEDEIQERLARVADAAEAAGYQRILVVADERSVLLDVRQRSLEKELSVADDERLHSVDAAVRIVSSDTVSAVINGSVHTHAHTQAPAAIQQAILQREHTP